MTILFCPFSCASNIIAWLVGPSNIHLLKFKMNLLLEITRQSKDATRRKPQKRNIRKSYTICFFFLSFVFTSLLSFFHPDECMCAKAFTWTIRTTENKIKWSQSQKRQTQNVRKKMFATDWNEETPKSWWKFLRARCKCSYTARSLVRSFQFIPVYWNLYAYHSVIHLVRLMLCS